MTYYEWLQNYFQNRKSERLYKWCSFGYERVDTEYGFSKLKSEDVWTGRMSQEARKQQNSVDYIGFYGD